MILYLFNLMLSASSGLYMDSEYYSQYPPGMKMTDGIPDDVS